MKTYCKPTGTKDLHERGQIILAHGEETGHLHSIDAEIAMDLTPDAEYFEELDGRRVLLALKPCVLRHPEHYAIALNPSRPTQVRQGDVLLNPIGLGAWELIRRREYSPVAIRNVLD